MNFALLGDFRQCLVNNSPTTRSFRLKLRYVMPPLCIDTTPVRRHKRVWFCPNGTPITAKKSAIFAFCEGIGDVAPPENAVELRRFGSGGF